MTEGDKYVRDRLICRVQTLTLARVHTRLSRTVTGAFCLAHNEIFTRPSIQILDTHFLVSLHFILFKINRSDQDIIVY